jgi:2'-5' RNA ligase
MRLFFALWPDAAVRAQLARWSALCHASSGGRPTRPQNLHATLAFLGEVAPARLPALSALAAQSVAPPFELALDHVGYWRRHRIVYAGTRQSPPAQLHLAR